MATYYVGPGGHDGNNGESWAWRKLTLNGVEDIPVVAGDTVYVGPGVYREKLTCDVSGTVNNHITYIADVTGENTDGVGGIVRITGSDNDTTATRDHCIEAISRDYRTFRGFVMDVTTNVLMDLDTPEHWVIEDCSFGGTNNYLVDMTGSLDITVRRCVFLIVDGANYALHYGTSTQDSEALVENCLCFGALARIDSVGGITFRNCMMLGGYIGIRVQTALPGGHTDVVVENSVITGCLTGLQATVLGEIAEDYNTLYLNNTDRSNVGVGGNSNTYPPLFLPPILHAGTGQASGFRFPWWHGDLSEWSQIAHITGNNEPSIDLWGIARPPLAADRSWGACQFQDVERDVQVTRGGSEASLVVHEPGRAQMWVPTSNVQTTISTYVYRLAGYSSITNPQMIIKQPGQADRVTTDAAAASQWNLLSDTFTPAADPPYVVVELVSNEGATSTSTSITSTSTTVTSTSTSTTSTSTSTTSTSISTSTTTLAYNVYFDDLSVN